MRDGRSVRGAGGQAGNGIFMRGINCPCCVGEMSWSNSRSQRECGCGKTIAITLVAKPVGNWEEDAENASEDYSGLSPGSLPRMGRLAQARIVPIRQLTH